VFLCRVGTGTCHKQTNLVRYCIVLNDSLLNLAPAFLVYILLISLIVLNEMCSSDSHWLDKEWKMRKGNEKRGSE